MRKEASSGRRAARGWTACCVLGGVRLGDPASVLPGVLRGIRTTREPAGGRGLQSLWFPPSFYKITLNIGHSHLDQNIKQRNTIHGLPIQVTSILSGTKSH